MTFSSQTESPVLSTSLWRVGKIPHPSDVTGLVFTKLNKPVHSKNRKMYKYYNIKGMWSLPSESLIL